MIISFSVFKEKILDGTKKQTIRRYTKKRYEQFCNAYNKKKKFQLYWGNPRNGGELLKEVEPDFIPYVISFDKNNRNFDEEKVAKADGFKNYDEMRNWFWEKYGMKMYTEQFMVIRWK